MKISKILNNNAVVVRDGQEEKIAIGTGIAYGKKKNDVVNQQKIEKLFVMKENEKLQQLLNRIPEEHFIISEKIITYAEEYIGSKLNEHIHIALTDHLSFAIEREQEGIHLKNKLLHEIKILYKQEYEIGLWAIKYIKEKCNIELPIDEAAYIALHIHTMKDQGGDMRQTVIQTTIIRDIVQTITEFLNIHIHEDDISYHRLITHLRFALTRMNQNELHTMDNEMIEMIKKKFPLSYQCATEIAKNILNSYRITLPEHELGYITLHIERLRKQWG
ncbi:MULTISPECIES: PRD domain-containing protein [Heyndrickxia]|uniref:PRD domain-containing protein n=1 Tax=Heyndrickxia sporothermodurans TaxID=46224 RepID=A0AB37HFC8_9BACI|nr:PRD domain-containing protein [Heyndrickxia sporothermodurans]MBL5772680.1 PRD domain-containing protein [Heyndrickxia sporothermodurans]MBL5779713.1 PRD domain-containing protein [Heyndrickxia sporothermodurans]MBL5783305.1 PRD domain-containing protein [Heyndrickxia sporothermodurans]MBL5790395.1 PRD domain-containing protein [Heyndrickxia sporothermodurans]MBL5797598.1 PRD domain-containing protein [Heyndrickxia sporothermodurans]